MANAAVRTDPQRGFIVDRESEKDKTWPNGSLVYVVESNSNYRLYGGVFTEFGMGSGTFGGFGNPTASVGLSAVNGTDTLAMRRDAAPALSQAIVPTWSGLHTFSNGLTVSAGNTTLTPLTGTGTRLTTSSSVGVQGNATSIDGAYTWTGLNTFSNGVTVSVGNTTLTPLAGTGTRLTTSTSTGVQGNETTIAGAYTWSGLGTFGAGLTVSAGSTTLTPLAGTGNRLAGLDASGVVTRTSLDPASVPTALANPTAQVGLSAVNGSATTAMRNDAAPALSQAITPTWTNLHTFSNGVTVSVGNTTLTPLAGTGNRIAGLDALGVVTRTSLDPANIPTALANPTAQVGLTTVNGSATTAMRSDAAPALNQAIVPTWTGRHVFSNALDISGGSYSGSNAQIFSDATNGLVIVGRTGSAYDLVIGDGAGSDLIRNPAGGVNLEFPGLIRVLGSGGFAVGALASTARIAHGTSYANSFTLLNTANALADVNVGRLQVGDDGSSPINKARIRGTNAAVAASGSAENGSLRIAGLSTSLILDIGVDGTGAASWLQSRDDNNYATVYKLALNPVGGAVGIGTANPTATLHVEASGSATFRMYDKTTNYWEHTATTNYTINRGGTELLRIESTGKVGIGTAAPASVLQVVGGTAADIGIRVQDKETNAATKFGAFKIGHYTNAEEPVNWLYGFSDATTNQLRIGGSTGDENAVTQIDFYTAANNITTAGTRRGGFNSSGNLDITSTTEATSATSASFKLAGGIGVVKKAFITGETRLGGETFSQIGHLDVEKPSGTGVLASIGHSGSTGRGEIYFSAGNEINSAYDLNASSSLKLNRNGYQNGSTQFRDLNIYDGKNNVVATFAGSDKSQTLKGRLDLFEGVSGTWDALRIQGADGLTTSRIAWLGDNNVAFAQIEGIQTAPSGSGDPTDGKIILKSLNGAGSMQDVLHIQAGRVGIRKSPNSYLDNAGSVQFPVLETNDSGTTALDITHYAHVFHTNTGGTRTLTLPAITSSIQGRIYVATKMGNGTLNLVRSGTDLIKLRSQNLTTLSLDLTTTLGLIVYSVTVQARLSGSQGYWDVIGMAFED